MAYDEELANRLRERLQDVEGLSEQRMFGGLAFLVRERAMNGWLRVYPDGVTTDDDLDRWVSLGVAYATSLPPKR